MDWFITTRVFDPGLEGKAVYLSGSIIEGDFVIVRVQNFVIEVIGATAHKSLPIEDFEHGAIRMHVYQKPREAIVVAAAKPEIKRKYVGRHLRTDEQTKKDNAAVERILQENIEPMKLEDILQRMRKAGYIHWSNNNASGFMKRAIQSGMNIKKAGYGVYTFDWEGKR